MLKNSDSEVDPNIHEINPIDDFSPKQKYVRLHPESVRTKKVDSVKGPT